MTAITRETPSGTHFGTLGDASISIAEDPVLRWVLFGLAKLRL